MIPWDKITPCRTYHKPLQLWAGSGIVYEQHMLMVLCDTCHLPGIWALSERVLCIDFKFFFFEISQFLRLGSSKKLVSTVLLLYVSCSWQYSPVWMLLTLQRQFGQFSKEELLFIWWAIEHVTVTKLLQLSCRIPWFSPVCCTKDLVPGTPPSTQSQEYTIRIIKE